MKYAKLLIEQLQIYDYKIKKHCFQYKKWKKYIKRSACRNITKIFSIIR